MRVLWIWPLLAVRVLAWKHVSEDALRGALKESDYTLVTCELPYTVTVRISV